MKIILLLFTSFVALVIIAIGVIYTILFLEVRNNCNLFQKEYNSGCVDTLIETIKSDRTTYKQKNDAIWTLGQLADARALPTLKSIYTGKIPPREPLDKTISQYEIRKAIHWIENGNLTNWMYWQYR